MKSEKEKYKLSKGNFYCKWCGKMKPVTEKVESFDGDIKDKKVTKHLKKVECVTCFYKRMNMI